MNKLKKIGIGFAIIVGLILVPITVSAQSTEIPAWVKGVANFWVEGNISDGEFGEAITFLIEQEIIKVEMPQQNNNIELEKKISQLESENSKLQTGNNAEMSDDVTCDEFYYDVMHFSIVDAFYGKLAEAAKNQGYAYDDEDLLKTSDELFKIAAHNGLSDADMKKFKSTCSDQLSAEQNLAVDYLTNWVSKYGF